jgi:predicted DNA-binding transcriptional regulator YafY
MTINKPQYARLLFIDEKIRSGSYPNASSISKEYEISNRTINRDIEYMRDSLGAPIEYDSTHKGFYYTEDHFFLPAIDIKESDFFAICITEQALKQYENTPLYDKLSGIFNKLKEYLPDNIRVNTTWIDTQFSFMHESFTTIDPQIWEIASRGLRQRNQLKIIHQKAGYSDAIERIVDPYHIVNYRGEWYLIGYCHLKKSVLRFAVSRIHEASVLETKYKIPSDFNFNSFIGSSFGIMTEDTEHIIKIQFRKELAPYIIERQWHPSQVIKQNEDGSIILSFTTNSLFEVKRWILSWGSGAKVIEPEILIKQVTYDIHGMLDSYKNI